MSVHVWLEDDIRNALAAVALASELLPNPHSDEDIAYLRGFRAALDILGTSFGVAIQESGTSPERQGLLAFQPTKIPSLNSGSRD